MLGFFAKYRFGYNLTIGFSKYIICHLAMSTYMLELVKEKPITGRLGGFGADFWCRLKLTLRLGVPNSLCYQLMAAFVF